MKMSEIRNMETAELKERLADLRMKYESLKITHVVSPLENPMQLRQMRRTIARLLTELNQRKGN